MITDVTDIRQDAKDAYRQSVEVGIPLTGKALGSMYERSERWGRAIIAEVRQTMPENGTPPEPAPAPDTRRVPLRRPLHRQPLAAMHAPPRLLPLVVFLARERLTHRGEVLPPWRGIQQR